MEGRTSSSKRVARTSGNVDDMVDASERRDDFRAIGLAIQGPAFAFKGPHRFITVDGHGQRVSQGARGLEITDVSGMQKIEAPIRQDKPFSLVAQRFRDNRQLIGVDNFSVHGLGVTN